MKQIIFIDENIPLLGNALESCGAVIRFSGRNLNRNYLIENGCTYLFIRSTTNINSELIEGTQVNFIGTATSGTDHVDTQYLKNKKITFAFAPGSNANSVAEYVVYSILLWSKVLQQEINNKTIGIVGFGNIGKLIAKYSEHLGLNILVNDPPLKDENYSFPDYVKYSELDDICKNADIITNHVPLTKESLYPTYKLFSKNIKLIKSCSLFIHTSRGGVVEESELLSKIQSDGIITAIDVWENEPYINKNLVNKSLIATPHIAGYSRDGKIRGAKMMADAFKTHSGIEPDYSEINLELSKYKPMSHGNFNDCDMLFSLLQKSRELNKDTAKLKEMLSTENNNDVDIFDRMRKNYPVRREIL
ncbi:MAG: 4-phosphoerythronate dehydrogenase [Bacteroidetes bacterium]|nr:MAG: 4-phosphoerythronate dehydrogenase [Bacteroidota bacterium]